MAVEQGWVALLEQRLADAGYNYRVANASISGDTTGGALARLDSLVNREEPDVTVVELGGNDGLRGISPDEMRRNLIAIVERLHKAGSQVVLVPMRMPPNYGPVFTEKFEAVYADIAHDYDIPLTDFILEDVALNAQLVQEDGIHPTAEAQPIMLENVWPAIETALENHATPQASGVASE